MILLFFLSAGLVNENMLHPLDSFTADNFDAGEFSYNLPFPLFGLSPGWAWWGITDWLTAEIDIECLLGGVPSFNFRVPVCHQKGIRTKVAFETMVQYLPAEINQTEDIDNLNVIRKGLSWYNRLNCSWQIVDRLHLYISSGGTYCRYLHIENSNRTVYYGAEFNDLLDPALSLGFNWRVSNSVSSHLSGSYGVTFVYLDNVSRKFQLCYGFRVAPFIGSGCGFLRNFRIEFSSINFYFADAREGVYLPIPIFPYLYWQWGRG